MAAVVRIFTYSEVITAPVAASSGRYSSDSIGLLKNPYLTSDQIEATTAAAVSTALASNTSVRLVQVQIEPNKIVHYETVPAGQARTATTASPFISGTVLLSFGPDWQLSLLEANF
jgi:hypothetical protein